MRIIFRDLLVHLAAGVIIAVILEPFVRRSLSPEVIDLSNSWPETAITGIAGSFMLLLIAHEVEQGGDA